MSRRRAAACLVALALGVSACSSSTSSSSSGASGVTGPVTVFAASSLTAAFTELGKQFEAAHPGVHVTFSFGASSSLAQQIIQGGPADVFASAAGTNMQQIVDAGDATGPRPFAANSAEIAVSPASTVSIAGVSDLAKPGAKVALCQTQVPCGVLAQAVLAKAGVTVTPVTQGLDVKSTLGFVTSGEVDAAIVYVTDVLAAGSAVKAVPIPDAQNASTTYPIALTTHAPHATAARAFVDFVLSDAGRSVLTAAGFSRP